MTKKKGRAYKRGEPTAVVTVRIPVSVFENIPEPKREHIVIDIIDKYNSFVNLQAASQSRPTCKFPPLSPAQ